MTIFNLLDGRDNKDAPFITRQKLYCLLRGGYVAPLTTQLINRVIKLADRHKVSIDLRFDSNLLNPLYFTLDGYTIYYLRTSKNKDALARSWGNEYMFLLDLLKIPNVVIKTSFENKDSGNTMYVLGENGLIVKEYIAKEMDV